MKIIVTERDKSDFIARLEGTTTVWGHGKTPNAAIGDLIRTNPEIFKLVVVDN